MLGLDVSLEGKVHYSLSKFKAVLVSWRALLVVKSNLDGFDVFSEKSLYSDKVGILETRHS